MKLFCCKRFVIAFIIVPLFNCFGFMLYSTRDRFRVDTLYSDTVNSYQKSMNKPPLRIETDGACIVHYYKSYSSDKNGLIFGPIPIFWSAPDRESVYLLKNEILVRKLSGPVSCEHGCWCTLKLSVWSQGGCSCSWGCADSVSLSEQIESICSK